MIVIDKTSWSEFFERGRAVQTDKLTKMGLGANHSQNSQNPRNDREISHRHFEQVKEGKFVSVSSWVKRPSSFGHRSLKGALQGKNQSSQ